MGDQIQNRAYSAECAAFRDGTTFEPTYAGPSEVRQSDRPLLPAHLMWPQQLRSDPGMARYLLRNYAAQDRAMRRRKPHADAGVEQRTAAA